MPMLIRFKAESDSFKRYIGLKQNAQIPYYYEIDAIFTQSYHK